MYTSACILYGPKEKLDIKSFGRCMFDNLKRKPAQGVALIDAHTKETKTYGQILEESVKLAYKLKQNGVCRNDVICIVSENNLNYVVPVLAALYVGAVIHPVNAAETYRELQHSFNISKPKWIFCSEGVLDTINKLRSEFKSIDIVVLFGNQSHDNVKSYHELLAVKDVNLNNFEPEIVDPIQQVAFVFSSSGTTGLPKGVMVTHQNMVQTMDYWIDQKYGNYQKGDVTVVPMPLFHLFGMNMLLVSIIASVKYVMINKFSRALYLKSIEQYKANKIPCPPTIILFFAKSHLVEGYDLSSLEDILSGSAPLKPETEALLRKRLNLTVRQTYATTETGGACTILPTGSSKSGSCGILLPNLVAKVRDTQTKSLLGPNQPGELCFKGPTIMKGYMNNPEVTANSFDDDGFYLSGDVGYYDEDGFFFIVDRLKDIIKYKGFQVAPAELEGILLQHPGVKDAAIIGIPDESAGELPLAFVVKEPEKEVTQQDILDFMAEHVSPEKRLYGGVRFIDEIPKNPSGKILRKCLRDLAENKI